jgi:3-methyladenine DNA glycosylase AlkD
MITARQVLTRLKSLADADIAIHSQRFFKTGKGEYGEGDHFLGIRVPVIRSEVKTLRDITLDETLKLLQSDLHEVRLFALLMLVEKFNKGGAETRGAIYRHYLEHLPWINNWDLIDSSAPYIVGAWLTNKERSPLYEMARSTHLWQRRIAILSTFHFIRNNDFDEALAIAALLVNDSHDLIHKAVGWMLREIGKREPAGEEAFLDRHAAQMPRTMLRYAIERLPEKRRKHYLAMKKMAAF